jgi:propanediol dehydratase small subunit
MLEITIDKLPGGDANRRKCLARITLTNTGQGAGGVKTYDVRITHADERVRPDLATDSCRTYRDDHEDVLRLAHRALGRLLGQPDPER